MNAQEFREVQRQHAQIWHRFRQAETEEEGIAIMKELFSSWPYNRTEKDTETNS